MGQAVPLPAWKKALFASIVFVAFFALLEGALALAGVRPRLAFEDPYVGFAGTIPLYVREGDHYRTSPAKIGWFNEQRFLARKPAGAFRIFSVGGSTTYGHPYDDRHSFSGWLRELLPAADASKTWEVVNAGGISYASYRVAALMEELAEYEPDLFLIYSGHNEFLERRTYEGLIEMPRAVTEVGGLLSRTRIYSAGADLLGGGQKRAQSDDLLAKEVDEILAHSVGPEDYVRDDDFRAQVIAHYEFNLRRMVEIARGAGAEAILITPASNWKDCSPFKSEPKAGLSPEQAAKAATLREQGAALRKEGRLEESLKALDASLEIDDRYAQTHYERGHTLLSRGRAADAKASFQRALEEDVCPLRAFPEMLDVVREVARTTGAPLIDFAAFVESKEPDGIPSAAQFPDHVHLNMDCYRELALMLIDEMERGRRLTKGPEWNDASIKEVRARVEAGFDRKAYVESLHNLSRVLGWAGKMDEAARLAELALEQTGADVESFNTLGRTAMAAGRRDEAIAWFRKAVQAQPNHPDANTNLGAELFALGKIDESIQHFQAALRENPSYWEAHLNMGLALSARDDSRGAERHFRLALEAAPRSHEAHNNLGVELVRLGRLVEAVECFREAIQWQPRFADAYVNLGQALTQLGQLEEAEHELRQAIEIGPETGTMHFNLGVALQNAGRIDEAAASYARAVELDPKLTGARHNRAVALLALGRDAEAVDELRIAIETDPEFARTHPEIRQILEGSASR
jgi:tetratricopeptide (TPR) repeat protein